MTEARVWPEEIREFVKLRAVPDVNWQTLATAVNQRWPGASMTPQAAMRIGKEFKRREARKERPATKNPSTCQYSWLEGGELHQCTAEGFPHCANHRKKLASAPSGSRWPNMRISFG